jgi:hypothetical protein
MGIHGGRAEHRHVVAFVIGPSIVTSSVRWFTTVCLSRYAPSRHARRQLARATRAFEAIPVYTAEFLGDITERDTRIS